MPDPKRGERAHLHARYGLPPEVVATWQTTPSTLLGGGRVLYWMSRGTQTGTDANGEPLFDAAEGSLWRGALTRFANACGLLGGPS